MKKQWTLNWLLQIAIVLLLFLCGYVFLKLEPIWRPIVDVIFTILIPFLIASFITYLLHPIVENLHNRGIPRSLAILIIYLLFFGGIGYGFYKAIPYAIEQLKELNRQLPYLSNTYQIWIREFYEHTSDLPEAIHTRFELWLYSVEEYVNNLISVILNSIKNVLDSFFVILIIPFLVFYMLKDIGLIHKAIWYLTPRTWRETGRKLIRDIDVSLGNYIRGQLFVCLLIAVLATIAFWIAGMPYPIILGVIIGVTDIIPYFGPFLGAIPVVLIASTISIELVIIVLSIILVLQFIEGNVLGPLIVGKSLHIHPIMIILALLIGGEVGGIVGLILAVPIFAVLKVVILHLRTHMIKH
jgi:predicted PurR-regulated permease PerM